MRRSKLGGKEMVDEVQDQRLSLDLPLVPLARPPVIKDLGMKILELINNSSLEQISKWEEWINSCSQNSKRNQSMVKKKKKQYWDHPPLSPMTTRSKVKNYVGLKHKYLGRRNLSMVMQDKARKNFIDASQRTIKECSRKKK